ncbi:Tetratricopeptide repeat protein 38 [Mizuhopecten yessoensis]|uniref:Tetratricopeptide repeat protein 38 n=1 Tax=Mizuhopecten yessoensis TaxID=6573 RepID=A0A210QYP3_MIZYE|nr:Tetratricopeptide repeat protein 38 [Mizuhopecten yessoensis]
MGGLVEWVNPPAFQAGGRERSQYVGWYDEESLGGLEGTCVKTVETDPNFVMGHVIKNGLEVLGTGRTIRLDQELDKDIKKMVSLGKSKSVTDREKKHVNAVRLWAEGEMTAATHVWEDILVTHPQDILALKFAHDSYFYLGYQPQCRDSIARVLPSWNKRMPLYGYLLGMYAFGLEECNHYQQAEVTARQGLDINRRDAWSTHAMAHVFEMQGRFEEGINFMSNTENDWNTCGMIACHNYWHYGVYNIEKGTYDDALGIFDSEIMKRAKTSGALLDVVDAASLLFRLQMEGVNVKDRWQDVFESCQSHIEDHIITFNDAHILFACLGSEKVEESKRLIDTLKDFVRNGKGDNRRISEEVGVPLCEGILAYENGEYARAVDLMYPIRYRIITIGGSHAQRDVFNQLLIQAAIKSTRKDHCKLARKENSVLSPGIEHVISKFLVGQSTTELKGNSL